MNKLTWYLRTCQLLILIILFSSAISSAQTFQWAKSIKSEGFDEGYDLAVDPDGYTYIAGMMEYDTDFGNGVILSSAGIHDIFLAKYTPTGRLVWAKRAGGKGGDKIQSIVLDGNGHIYVAGEFEDTCYWDGIMKITTGLGINNMFVAKYDTSGPVIWVSDIHGVGVLHTRGYGVTCDAQGNVYACGGTKGDTYHDSTFLFTSAGDYDGTVVKFDPNGNFVWARRMGGADSDKAYGIVSDNNGSIYVTGYFVGTADFAPGVNLNGNGHTDIFLAKYNTAGTLQWAKMAGDTGFDRGWDVTINVNGDILITGEFQTGYFGPNLVYSRGNEDMFLASYDSNGNNNWALSGGGPEDDIGRGVSHDTAGNIFVVGDYASEGIFQPDTVIANGYADVFLASYKSDGSAINWVRSIGGLDSDRGRGVGTDLAGNVYICGEFIDSIRFDNTNMIGDTLLDIFISRVIQCNAQLSATAESKCNGQCDGTGVAIASGQSPFTYNWSTTPPQSGDVATGLCAGNYIVTITDAGGCTATAYVNLIDPPLLQTTTSITNSLCAGACDGIANVSANGNGPFTYFWSTTPPQTNSTATALCQGNYIVITTDIEGCANTSSVSLTDPLPLQMTSVITNSNCVGCNDGSINLSVNGGTTLYQYLWSDGSITEDLQNILAGTYNICVTDANNCTLCDTYIVLDSGNGITINNNQGYSIFPNPFNTFTTIHLNIPAGETTKVVLFTATGQIAYQTEFNGNEFRLPANDLSSGVYFLQLNNKMFNGMKMVPVIVGN